MFFYNYVDLCNKKHISPSAAAEEMGFKRSVVTRWSQGTQPRQATLQKIADYFGVSVAELTIENEQNNKPAPLVWDELTEEQQKAFDLILKMTDVQLKRFIAAAEAFLE